MSKTFIAEVIGTAILVLFGCGAAVLMGAHIGMLGIALAFGLSIVAAAYGIGPISGAHLTRRSASAPSWPGGCQAAPL